MMTSVAVQSTAGGADTAVVPQPDFGPGAGKVAEKPARETASTEAESRKISSQERDGLLKQLNKTLEAFDTHVSLSVDEKSHQTIIKVIDNNSGKVVRQIPSEQLMRVSERITELLGVIYDEKM